MNGYALNWIVIVGIMIWGTTFYLGAAVVSKLTVNDVIKSANTVTEHFDSNAQVKQSGQWLEGVLNGSQDIGSDPDEIIRNLYGVDVSQL